MINKAGRQKYGSKYISYPAVDYVEIRFSKYLMEVVHSQPDVFMDDDFWCNDFADHFFGVQGLAHAMDTNGNFLDLPTIKELGNLPKRFYLAAMDECGKTGNTVYTITNDLDETDICAFIRRLL